MPVIDAVVRMEHGAAYGMFRFAVLPRPGDRVTVTNRNGSADVLDVLYVQHLPVEVPPVRLGNTTPIVTVIVELFRRLEDLAPPTSRFP